MNFWTAKSKYGATIQTAVDYAMNINPKSEDLNELVPHIAATAAAYGDPTGKYANFLERTMPDYKSKPFFFYDQTAAFPASRMNKYGERADVAATVPFECPDVFKTAAAVELDNEVFVTCTDLRPFYERQ